MTHPHGFCFDFPLSLPFGSFVRNNSLSLSGPRRGEREGERSVPYATALCPSHFCAQFTRKGEKEEVIKLEIKNKGWRPRLLPWMEEVGVTKVSQVSYVSMLRQVCKEGGRRRRR